MTVDCKLQAACVVIIKSFQHSAAGIQNNAQIVFSCRQQTQINTAGIFASDSQFRYVCFCQQFIAVIEISFSRRSCGCTVVLNRKFNYGVFGIYEGCLIADCSQADYCQILHPDHGEGGFGSIIFGV